MSYLINGIHCHVELGLQLVKSREHLSARVLSTTDEDQTKKENPIKLVTGGIRQGNQVGGSLEKGDGTGENVNGEVAIDVDGNDGKLARSTSLSTQDPQIKVGDILCFCCFYMLVCVFFLCFLLPHSLGSCKY